MALYAFDGSWMDGDLDPVSERTNVYRFRDLYEISAPGHSVYWHGVGRRHGRLGKAFGGAAGIGAGRRVREALYSASGFFSEGDEQIDIIGFSRGAASAVAFVWALHKLGIRAPRKTRPRRLPSAVSTWRDMGDTLNYRMGTLLRENPPIRFLGLFDTVLSTLSLDELIPWRLPNALANRLDRTRKAELLPQNVASAFHALAIHERRPFFNATRLDGAYEVWFPGVHSHVGGGSSDSRIADIALKWMIHKAQLAGVPIEENEELAKSRPELPEELISDTAALERKILPGDKLHESALSLSLNINFTQMQIESA